MFANFPLPQLLQLAIFYKSKGEGCFKDGIFRPGIRHTYKSSLCYFVI